MNSEAASELWQGGRPGLVCSAKQLGAKALKDFQLDINNRFRFVLRDQLINCMGKGWGDSKSRIKAAMESRVSFHVDSLIHDKY